MGYMYSVLLLVKTKKECEAICAFSVWEQLGCFQMVYKTKTLANALEYLIHNPVDLVLCDINISGMGGITLLDDVKKNQTAQAVVLVAAKADIPAARRALAYGAFDYLAKPVEEERLEDILQRTKFYLDDMTTNREHMDNLIRIVLDKVGHYFPKAQISQLVARIENGDSEAVDDAVSMITQTSKALDNDFYKLSFIISRSMHEVVNRVYEQNLWLGQFLQKQEVLELATAEYEDMNGLIDASVEATGTLCGCMRNLALRHIENPTIRRLADYVTDNLDKELSLESLSEKLYISKTYLSELFKSKTGCAITEYLTRVKMEKARNIILEKHLKTKEVASMLGYKDFVYFSKLYKKYWGTTPGQLNKR